MWTAIGVIGVVVCVLGLLVCITLAIHTAKAQMEANEKHGKC